MLEWLVTAKMKTRVMSFSCFCFLQWTDTSCWRTEGEETEEQLRHIDMFIHAVKQLRCWRGLQSRGWSYVLHGLLLWPASVFGLWVRGWSIPQHAARLWTPHYGRLLFEQTLPGVTLTALHHLKGQAQQMARKTVLSLAINSQLTTKCDRGRRIYTGQGNSSGVIRAITDIRSMLRAGSNYIMHERLCCIMLVWSTNLVF